MGKGFTKELKCWLGRIRVRVSYLALLLVAWSRDFPPSGVFPGQGVDGL